MGLFFRVLYNQPCLEKGGFERTIYRKDFFYFPSPLRLDYTPLTFFLLFLL